MTSVLDKIVAAKWREIAAAKAAISESAVRERAASAGPTRDFFSPLAAPGPIRLIAEVKKASPSKGVIREDFDPVEIAKIHERHRATCLSVLTDREFFQGDLAYLTAVREAVELPLLRKDFILDPYQVYEARAAGADAVLLIAECLDNRSLKSLHALARSLDMAALVELYDPENLQRAFDAGATLIGVNNRDLRSFETDLEHTLRLRNRVPDQCVLVSESGIRSRADVERLEAAGVDAILVGETLMASPDIGAAVDALLGMRRQ
jgi:indole-3-glycerol phosphate synthase